MTKIKMPPGKYFIGDPCYAVTGADEWDELLKKSGYNDLNGGFFANSVSTLRNGKPVFASSTAFGDGCYKGSDGYFYSVDAGLIGCTPLEENLDEDELKGLGRIADFLEEFTCYAEDDKIYIDNICIDTGFSNYPDDENDENDDDDFS